MIKGVDEAQSSLASLCRRDSFFMCSSTTMFFERGARNTVYLFIWVIQAVVGGPSDGWWLMNLEGESDGTPGEAHRPIPNKLMCAILTRAECPVRRLSSQTGRIEEACQN